MKLIQLTALRNRSNSIGFRQKIARLVSILILCRFHQKLSNVISQTNFIRSLHKLVKTIVFNNSIKISYKLVRAIFKLVKTNFCIKLIGVRQTITLLIFFVIPIELAGTNFKIRFPYFYKNLIQLAKSSSLLNFSLNVIEIRTLQVILNFCDPYQKISPFRTLTNCIGK